MAVNVTEAPPQAEPVQQIGRPPSSIRFDWLMLAVSFWPLAGALSDAYAHSNFPKLETFFTPWHALLYSGLFAVALCNVLVMRRNHARGYPWARSIAAGYELTIAGTGVLFVGGVFDLIWHTLFGIERNIEANASPSHLLIQAGILLILAGPLRSAFSRHDDRNYRGLAQLPMILSLTFTYTMVTILTEYAQPFIYRFAAAGDVDLFANNAPIDSFLSESIGLMGFIIQGAMITLFVLIVARRWRLLPGTLTCLFTVDIAVLSLIQQDFSLLPAAAVAGILGDLLVQAMRPDSGKPVAVRMFAFTLPAVYFACYFANLLIVQGIVWKPHLWLGSIFIAGIVGWALSYLMIPPQSSSADAVS